MTPEQRQKHLKALEKIEHAKRPAKWRLIRDLLFELKPWLKPLEKAHNEACKELRQKNENEFAASKAGTTRNTMKLFGPVYSALIKADPDLKAELSGLNKGDQQLIGKNLWDAFPEYRICRKF